MEKFPEENKEKDEEIIEALIKGDVQEAGGSYKESDLKEVVKAMGDWAHDRKVLETLGKAKPYNNPQELIEDDFEYSDKNKITTVREESGYGIFYNLIAKSFPEFDIRLEKSDDLVSVYINDEEKWQHLKSLFDDPLIFLIVNIGGASEIESSVGHQAYLNLLNPEIANRIVATDSQEKLQRFPDAEHIVSKFSQKLSALAEKGATPFSRYELESLLKEAIEKKLEEDIH